MKSRVLYFCAAISATLMFLVFAFTSSAEAGEVYRCKDGKNAGSKTAIFIFVFKDGVSISDAAKRIRRNYILRNVRLLMDVKMMIAVVKGKVVSEIACDESILYIEKDSVFEIPKEQNPKRKTVIPVPQPLYSQRCPDEWIIDSMPGPNDSGLPNAYFIVAGKRRELSEFDLSWVKTNCDLQPTHVQ